MKKHTSDCPEVIEGAPLHYAPQNEIGVVYDMIIRRNTSLKRKMFKFAPENL